MRSPEVHSMKLDGDSDLQLPRELPYLIVNKSRLSYVYDFNAG